MKRFRIFLIIGLILSIALYSVPAFAASANASRTANVAADSAGSAAAVSPATGDPDESDYIAGRMLVKFKDGTEAETMRQVHSRHNATVVGEIKQLGVQIVNMPGGRVPDHARAYRSEPSVLYAEPDYIAKAFEVGPDPYIGQQWGMTTIQAPLAWDISSGNGVKIAILDTGVDQDHPDLQGKVIANQDFTGSGVDDLYGHGTHVAGIAAAATNNNLGVAGVGDSCSIMNVKVLDNSGSGAYSWIANGIVWAADHGAKVINMSLGGKSGSTTLQNAINTAWEAGVVIVAAAGNNGNSRPSYPAYYEHCIAVASTTQDDSKSSFSNYGSWVDVAAPGSSIFSTLPNHPNAIGGSGGTVYGSLSGTSMASPHVAGLAGLVWASSYGSQASNADVRARIEQTAEKMGSIWNSYSIPRVNALNAVDPSYTVFTPTAISNLAAATTLNSATVTWTTNVAATTKLEYGLTTAYGIAIYENLTMTTAHVVTLAGLDAAKTYYYRVTSVSGDNSTATATGSFKTKRK